MVATTRTLSQERRKALQLCAEVPRFGVFDASGVMLGCRQHPLVQLLAPWGGLWCDFWTTWGGLGVTKTWESEVL